MRYRFDRESQTYHPRLIGSAETVAEEKRLTVLDKVKARV